jgi:hypothetical protein
MCIGIADGCVEPQHIHLQSSKLHAFQATVWRGANATGRDKILQHETRLEVVYSPLEAKSKDLIETEKMKVVKKLQAYQNEMTAWRDKKVKEKIIEVRDLVLL